MNAFGRIAIIIALVFVLVSGTYACSIDTGSLETLVRGTGSYDSTISASQSQDIDVRINFNINDFSGTDCPSQISANAIVTRYNNDTGDWENYRTLSTKSQDLSNDNFTFTWDNAFNTGSNDKYTTYSVEGQILAGSEVLDSQEADVDVSNNSCSGISLVANDFTIDEGTSNSRLFYIENNTNNTFDVSNVDVSFTSGLIQSSSSADFDNIVDPHSSGNVTLSIDAGFVSSDSTTTGRFEVSGYLGNNFCSVSDIGTQTFDVTVNSTGANSDNSDNFNTTSSDCSDITLNANDTTMDEGTSAKPVITLRNDSTRRFEILDIKTTQNGIDLSKYYNDKYVFPSQVSDIVLRADAPNVTQDKTYENTVWVRGIFSDGRSCTYDNITEAVYNTAVLNNGGTVQNTCSNFSIDVPSTVNIQNTGTLPFTITNGTNQRADVYVEGTVEAVPTIISLPANTAISRSLTLLTNATGGEIVFRPVVAGCTLAATRTVVTNTATGTLSRVSMGTSVERDQNTGAITLNIEFTNPTNKIFSGVISVSAPRGWVSSDLPASVSPGKSIFRDTITPTSNAQEGDITVTFSADGQQITSKTSTTGTALAGLFALGANAAAVAIILIVIVAIIVLVAVVSGRKSNPPAEVSQTWVDHAKADAFAGRSEAEASPRKKE